MKPFHYLKKLTSNGGHGVALKLDMNKAYDRVNWDFLKFVLLAYGFSPHWVNLVMTLVTTVSYSYQVNGFSSRVVHPNRGLRQGGPFSPYLFILVFDVLSRLINEARAKNLIQGIKLAARAPSLTPLILC